MDCEGCGRKIKNVLSALNIVSLYHSNRAETVEVDWKQQKTTVYGCVDAKKVLKAAQATRKKVEPWPYVPYERMAHPYAAGVYDKRAPANLVRGTNEPGVATLNPIEEKYTHMFSDDNPQACCVM
ncbi:hypothetical protein OROGR_021262 [Orobanche gracilis]